LSWRHQVHQLWDCQVFESLSRGYCGGAKFERFDDELKVLEENKDASMREGAIKEQEVGRRDDPEHRVSRYIAAAHG
jgi:hypothetical protein